MLARFCHPNIDALKGYPLSSDELQILQKLFEDNVDELDNEMFDQFPALYEQVHGTDNDFDEWYQKPTAEENRLQVESALFCNSQPIDILFVLLRDGD